jgi:urea transport system ATP-binding protein
MIADSNILVPEILRVEGVTVRFGDFTALNNLSLTLRRGELRVVIGPNGAGKTTLLDVITGKARPRSGRVVFQPHGGTGRDLTRLSEQTISGLGVGRKFQTPNVFKSLTVIENLQLALKYPRGVFATLAAAFRQDGRGRVEEILAMTGLGGRAYGKAGILSHGEKQWLELGMLMAQAPELLLVDEPVAGMTPRESERTGELLSAMARKHTLLVIEHDMSFVRQIAEKVTVLDEGKMLFEGTVDEVHRNEKVIEVYLGHDKKDTSAAKPAHRAAGVSISAAQ